MLTWIGIGIVIAAAACYSALTIVKQGYYIFVKRFGGKIKRVLPPGTHITWPWPIDHKEEIKIERITKNIKEIIVTCNVQQLAAAGATPDDLGAVAEFKSEQVSLNFVVSFQRDHNADKFSFDQKMVEVYVRYLTAAEKQEDKLAKLTEEVTDIIQAKFRDKAIEMNYTDVMKLPQKLVENIRDETQKECDNKNIPINIIFLKLNNPFKPVDKNLEEALEKIAKESFMRRADQIEFDKKKMIAEREKEIKVIGAEADAKAITLKAEAQAASIRTIAKALGVDLLPNDQQAAFLLSKEALDTYAKMFANPGAKFVISGNVMDEIKTMLSKFTRGAP